ncbi:MAG: hypothetical protein IT228_10935 [Flavobacteriales bacterium]|nr:hypothetical protein [Flavobacteriales bacterium]MCC6577846.1 hypothetical protein [Flavobacteriales bacterium]NUQ14566.1 hypothetical protein [Flavobacteriales bacterium]
MRTVALLLALVPGVLPAQVLRILPSEKKPDHPSWDTAFMRRNAVAAIIGTTAVKVEGKPMYDLPERVLYRFDPAGRMVYANTSRGRPGSGTDTTSVIWEHDSLGRPLSQLRTDIAGHYLLETAYDSTGRAVGETYVRVANLGPDRYHFRPGERTVIGQERFGYRKESDTAWVRVYRNDLDLPYREQRHAYDRWGYLRSIEDLYLMSGRRSRVEFRYDEKGRLAERTEKPDLRGPQHVRETYRYDTVGNLLATELYQDDRLVRHEELLYEEGTMFLKARLSKDVATGRIQVVRYRTERR